jgi:hypothetical protein
MAKYEVTDCDLKLGEERDIKHNEIELVKRLKLIISLQFIAHNYKSKKL